MFSTDELLYEKDGTIATITINRPQAHNAISADVGRGLDEAMADFEADPDLRVAILTGAGTKAFSAGGDLKTSIPNITDAGGANRGDPTKRPFSEVTKPIIGAVNGLALAGGMEILLGTDLRVAADHAVFGLPEPTLGLVPFAGSHVRLPQQVPWAVAMEMLLLGDSISAQRAYEIGLVNRVVPGDQVMAEARRLATRICHNGPLAVRTVKETVLASYNLPRDEAFQLEHDLTAAVLVSEDAKEGPRAFVEKRPPMFTGR
jgi:enoyl-CoA hydratase